MLYIVNKKGDVLRNCLETVSTDDVILLIESAVYAAVNKAQSSVFSERISGVVIYALLPDMQARGIDVARCYEHIQYVDYAGFIDLVEQNNPVRSCC